MAALGEIRALAGAERRFYGGMAIAVSGPLRLLVSRTDEWVAVSHSLVNLVK
jgi:hypothetical protein